MLDVRESVRYNKRDIKNLVIQIIIDIKRKKILSTIQDLYYI